MKNLQKGFVVPLVIAIVAVLAIGWGVYYSRTNKHQFEQSNTSLKNTTDNQNVDWKTFSDTQFGFRFKYPPDWKVNNQSFVYQSKPSINVLVSSPIHPNLVGTQDAVYLLQMGVDSSVATDLISGEKIISYSGFFKAPFVQADGGPVKIDINDTVVKNSIEYKQAQQIFASFETCYRDGGECVYPINSK